ncbi:MAG: hypothetical protein ACM357_05115, partial [Gemmatimonadota bacterium]
MLCRRGWAFAVCLGACESDDGAGPSEPPPAIGATVVLPNPANALSAFIELVTSGGDSARIVFAEGDGPVRHTPFQVIRPGMDTVVVLGLRP